MAKASNKFTKNTATMPESYKPSSSLTITDYTKDVLGNTIKKLKVGQKVKLTVGGEVTRLEERYSKGKDSYDNRCELQMDPKSVVIAGLGNMVSEVNHERKKRGGGYYDDEEGD